MMICRTIAKTIRTADWIFAHVLATIGEAIDTAIPSPEEIRANLLAKYEENIETWEPGELDEWGNLYNHHHQDRK